MQIRNLSRISSGILAMALFSLIHIYYVSNLTRKRQISSVILDLDVPTFNATLYIRSQAKEHPTSTSIVESLNTNSVDNTKMDTNVLRYNEPSSPNVTDKHKIYQLAVLSYRRRVNATNRNAKRCVARRRSSYP
jgi:hypothetical protein